jgi:hypothetical protein
MFMEKGPARRGLGNLTALLALVVELLLVEHAAAQKAMQSLAGLAPPQLHMLTPRGGKAGTTVEVTVSGFNLDGVDSLLFSQAGIKAELIKTPPPLKTDNKNPRGGRGQPRGMRGQQPSPDVKFKVTIPAGTALGIHDIRVVGKGGISNPRAFVVGDLEEVQEKEPNNDVAQAQRVELNTTINGSIANPSDVDYFIFAGKKGQRVVLSCLTTSIASQLPAAIELYDSKDRQLAFNRNYNENDALTDCTLPADGDYFVRLYGFTYTQGGPYLYYRLSITTAPWIDAVFPPMVEPGKKATLTVLGRNLPGGKLDPTVEVDGLPLEKATVTIDVPADPTARQRLAFTGHIPVKSSALDGFTFRLKNDAGESNPFLLTLAQAPVVLDNAANVTPETAQEVALPCEIAGRIEKKHERGWYTFTANKGDVYSIEAYGDRLGAPVDLFMTLRDAKTKRTIIELDDNPDILNRVQLFTRSDDPPRYRFQVPADGAYQLMVSSREASVQGGPRDYYRVRITPEQPDFRLVVMPSSQNSPDACVVRQGGHQDYSVFVWRLDGWNGPINLNIESLPEGVTCPPQTIGGGVRETSLVLKAAKEAPPWTGAIKIRGTATINGKTVVREARAATILWPVPPQQNVSTLSRIDREVVLAVRDKAPFNLEAGIDSVVAVHGSKITIPLKLTRLWPDFKAQVRILPLNLPGRIQFQPIILSPGKDEAKLSINVPNNVPPGVYTLVLRGQAQLTPDRRNRNNQNQLTQPATPVALTIVPKSLATVNLSTRNLKARPGSKTEVEVRLSSRYDTFAGDYKVQLVLNGKARGIHAEEVTVPSGQDRIKLMIEVDEDAQPGTQIEALVRATAMVGKTPVVQETRLSVAVDKPVAAKEKKDKKK